MSCAELEQTEMPVSQDEDGQDVRNRVPNKNLVFMLWEGRGSRDQRKTEV